MYIKKANQIYGSATKLPLSILKIRTVNERQAKSKEFYTKMKKFIEENREDIQNEIDEIEAVKNNKTQQMVR